MIFNFLNKFDQGKLVGNYLIAICSATLIWNIILAFLGESFHLNILTLLIIYWGFGLKKHKKSHRTCINFSFILMLVMSIIVFPIVGVMGIMQPENVSINGYSASDLSTLEFSLNYIITLFKVILLIYVPYKILNSEKANAEFTEAQIS